MGSKPMCKVQEKELEKEILQDSQVKSQVLKQLIPFAALRNKQAQLRENSPLPEKNDTDIDELTLHFRELELRDQFRRLRINRFRAEPQSLSQNHTHDSNSHSRHHHSNPQTHPIKGILKQHGQNNSQRLFKSVQFKRNTHPKLKAQHERIHHQLLSLQFKASIHQR